MNGKKNVAARRLAGLIVAVCLGGCASEVVRHASTIAAPPTASASFVAITTTFVRLDSG